MSVKITTSLQEEVETRLREDWLLRDFPVNVFDDDGIIVLTGKVPSKTVSLLIEALVLEADDVAGIANMLFIQPHEEALLNIINF